MVIQLRLPSLPNGAAKEFDSQGRLVLRIPNLSAASFMAQAMAASFGLSELRRALPAEEAALRDRALDGLPTPIVLELFFPETSKELNGLYAAAQEFPDA